MNLELIRFESSHEATLGDLIVGPVKFATLEEPWRPNPFGPGGQAKDATHEASCVPEGSYRLERHNGMHWSNTWALVNPQLGVYHWPTDIPAGQAFGRSAVLIHVGNSTGDIEGCIALGLRHGREVGKPWIYQSAAALEQLRGILGHEEHTLEIRKVEKAQEAAA